MYRLIPIAVLLGACAVEPIPSPHDALAVWEGPPGTCAEQADAVQMAWVPRGELAARCNAGRAYDARYTELGLRGCWRRDDQLAVMREDDLFPGELAAHELTHWLFDCSGLPPGDDHAHSLFSRTVEALTALGD